MKRPYLKENFSTAFQKLLNTWTTMTEKLWLQPEVIHFQNTRKYVIFNLGLQSEYFQQTALQSDVLIWDSTQKMLF